VAQERSAPVASETVAPNKKGVRCAVLSAEVTEFLRSSVKSVWALEALLFVRRRAERAWTVDALVTELRSSSMVVSDLLGGFVASGLVRDEGEAGYRYAPANPALDYAVAQVEKAYAERPIAVTKAILSAPNDKIQSFADAFRLRKD
jgi:hypothetical protein